MDDKQKKLLREIADAGELMPGRKQWHDLCALERDGLVELAGIYHPCGVTWRVTDRGRQWLDAGQDVAPAAG